MMSVPNVNAQWRLLAALVAASVAALPSIARADSPAIASGVHADTVTFVSNSVSSSTPGFGENWRLTLGSGACTAAVSSWCYVTFWADFPNIDGLAGPSGSGEGTINTDSGSTNFSFNIVFTQTSCASSNCGLVGHAMLYGSSTAADGTQVAVSGQVAINGACYGDYPSAVTCSASADGVLSYGESGSL